MYLPFNLKYDIEAKTLNVLTLRRDGSHLNIYLLSTPMVMLSEEAPPTARANGSSPVSRVSGVGVVDGGLDGLG